MTTVRALWSVSLQAHHVPTGRTRHYRDGELLAAPASLLIGEAPPMPGYYLLYVDHQGQEMTDTWHFTLEDAMHQAEVEFQVTPDDWTLCD